MNILAWIYHHHDLELELHNLKIKNEKLTDEVNEYEMWQMSYLKHIHYLERKIDRLKLEVNKGNGECIMNGNSKISQLAYVNELSDGGELDKGTRLNVKQLMDVLSVLVDEGYGDYSIRVGYDCDCASTSIYNQFDIMADAIVFREMG